MKAHCKFKGSNEDISSFLEDFPKLFASDCELGFIVKLRAKTNRLLPAVYSSSTGSLQIAVHPGWLNVNAPAVNSMIEKSHPDMMLRPREFISIKHLAELCGLDKTAVDLEVFKSLKSNVSKALKTARCTEDGGSKFWLTAASDDYWLNNNRLTTAKFSSIYDLVMRAGLAS